LGMAPIQTPFTIVSSSINWSNPQGGFWDDPRNWDAGRVPGADDNVFIGLQGGVVTFRQGVTTVNSLTCFGGFTLKGGTLRVREAVAVSGAFTLTGGSLADGVVSAGTAITVQGGTLDGVTLNGNVSVTGNNTLSVQNGLVLNG